MWEPFRQSIQRWAPQCKIIYDKFHIMQHANQAVDEGGRSSFAKAALLARW
jgi:transposase